MKLPNANLAIVASEKVTNYLLNPAHPDNAGKAEFFATLGFNREDWQKLADAFRKLAQSAEVSKSMTSPHGQKYILDGRIEAPSGKEADGADDLDYGSRTERAAFGDGVSKNE